MGSLNRLALICAATLAMGESGIAADMLRFPVESAPESISQPVELGSGWYLRGDASWSRDRGPQIAADIPITTPQHNWVVDLGAGYKFNNWFRGDMTVSFNKMRDLNLTGSNVTCPYQLTGLSTQAATPVQLGYLWDTIHDTCSSRQNAQLTKTDLMFNGYVDLGNWFGITPYLGAGAGLSALSSKASLNYYKTSDGSLYAPDLTPTGTFPHIWIDAYGNPISPQPTVGFAKQDWSRKLQHTGYNLAWALMGGVAIDVNSHTKIDIGYRYQNSGTYTSLASPVTGAVVKSTITSQQVRVGMRYTID